MKKWGNYIYLSINKFIIFRCYKGSSYNPIRFGFSIFEYKMPSLFGIHFYKNEIPKKTLPTRWKYYLCIYILYLSFSFKIGLFPNK